MSQHPATTTTAVAATPTRRGTRPDDASAARPGTAAVAPVAPAAAAAALPTPSLPPPPTPWFVALPDTSAAVVVAAGLSAAAAAQGSVARVLRRRSSGRPLLVGRWADDGLVSATAGPDRLAVLVGRAAVGADELARRLARVRDVTGATELIDGVAGSFHLIAEIDGRCRVQGTASGLRRVFHAVAASGLGDGVVVAGDRADVVATLAGCPLDLAALALSLVDPVPPHPLADRPLWHGVTAVPPDEWLCLDPPPGLPRPAASTADGAAESPVTAAAFDVGHGCANDGWRPRATHVRWWRPPAPELGRRAGAAALRQALIDAVDVRTAAGGTVTADLSGGLDSTALCFLAARGPADLVPYTGVAHDPGTDDARWAALARAALLPSGGPFELLPRTDVPLVYDQIEDAREPLDRPFIGVIDRAKLLAGLRLAARHDPRLHLCGLGGDEIAQGSPNHIAGLARGHPLAAAGRLRALRAQHRWPLAASLWTLRPRSYRAWLAGLLGPPPPGRAFAPPAPVAELDWSLSPRVPEWLSPYGRQLLREALTAVIADPRAARPLGATRDRHADLFTIRVGAAAARGFTQLAGPHGPPLELPFYDDRVVEAALSVRAAERATPWEYKPLLTAAMAGIVPDECLRRTTKAEGSAEVEAGLRANQQTLRALFADSRLAELGLADERALAAASRYTASPDRPHDSLQTAAAAEVWLSTVPGAADPRP
ncbi:MAG: asparagine synthase [Frankia sp.]|nr:asparagine synthase [Frankia sp.]